MPSTKPLPTKSNWLRANTHNARAIGVDRDAGVIRGYVVAQEGIFKSQRGEFDEASLSTIQRMINQSSTGLKSRFAHPTLSDDGIGKHLGRSRNAVMSKTSTEWDGKSITLRAVRADLHFDESAYKTPSGDLATYVMDLAESDPDAISSSLVLQVDEEFRLDRDGNPLVDKEGNMLPPLWRPTKLHASDIVDTGDAVDGLLSVDALPDAIVRQGASLLDAFFEGQTRDVIEERALSWLLRYLDNRFGPVKKIETPILDKYRLRIQEAQAKLARVRGQI